jgi:hypothetical protein
MINITNNGHVLKNSTISVFNYKYDLTAYFFGHFGDIVHAYFGWFLK